MATAKAKDLVRMAVARAALLTPQKTIDVSVEQTGLVVGGGAGGDVRGPFSGRSRVPSSSG